MHNTMKYVKWIFGSIFILIFSFICFLAILFWQADMGVPTIEADVAGLQKQNADGYTFCQGGMLRKNEFGLWEIRLEGSPEQIGSAQGLLARELLYYQESVFVRQIREIIPSDSYLRILRLFTIIFNRNFGNLVPEEFRREIYALSLFCTDEFNQIGTPYERQLNYHAAHDIGHTMQDYMLVGCSSFAAWNTASADSTLIVGRNFDFYVGDEFAENKLISFVKPDQGYRYVSIGWAGMIGVLSGMNEKGITITLNAAKGIPPLTGALPISLLAREILQYAATVDEAYQIAQSRKTFVSESLLIGSASEKKAVLIEKTPQKIALYESPDDWLVSTNHYQSETFRNDPTNLENIETSDSKYRFDRMTELLNNAFPLTVVKSADILRNRAGLYNRYIGLANEKAINQSIAHHSVIFNPDHLQMWVSTAPWQDGAYICYDLNKIFGLTDFASPIHEQALTIPADSIFLKYYYPQVCHYRASCGQIKKAIQNGETLNSDFIAAFIRSNPNHYYVYTLLGDYFDSRAEKEQAHYYWTRAVECEVPSLRELNHLNKKLKR